MVIHSLFLRVASCPLGLAILLLGTSTSTCNGEEKAQDRPAPTHADMSYGPHERNVVDLYRAKSNEPTPVLVFFHGGGFRGGDKREINVGLYRLCVKNGISFAAANYRLTQHAPYPAQMHDSARAIQLLRSMAGKLNLDSNRIAAFGGSAGAGISLWLAMQDDMANPDAKDPIARQSTRLSCAIGLHAQTTYDPREIKEIVPGRAYDNPALKHLFGLSRDWDWDDSEVDEALSARLREASPIAHLTKDDPPIFVWHHKSREVPGEIHHANFGRYLEKKMRALGIECVRGMGSDKADMHNARGQNQDIFDFVRKHFEH